MAYKLEWEWEWEWEWELKLELELELEVGVGVGSSKLNSTFYILHSTFLILGGERPSKGTQR